MSGVQKNQRTYVLDTNTLIGFATWIPISLNKAFWNKLEQALQQGKWILLDVVCDEVLYNDVKNWISKQKKNGYVTSIDDNDRKKAVEINANYEMIDQKTFKSKQDPYIIAYSFNKEMPLFTREKKRNNPEDLYKIPDVCDILKIKWIRDPEVFLRSIGYKDNELAHNNFVPQLERFNV